ncbi:methyl-accepting chemotaxis protein [Cohnella yongneupensis]|uniref:Methyl-accepting chemotaxis protein n=1 Tax=Cohnella yongneupensis TaxID=425006 RepID=A0ABW0QWM8_9BACL
MKLTIGKKLLGAFLVIAILLGITSLISLNYLNKINKADADLINRRAVILSNAQGIQLEATKQASGIHGYLVSKESAFKDQVQSAHIQLSAYVIQTLMLAHRAEDQQRLKNLDELNKQYKAKADQLFLMVQNNENAAKFLNYYQIEVQPLGDKLLPLADDIASGQKQLMKEGSANSASTVDTAIKVVTALSAIAFVLAILIGYFASRAISKPIVAMESVAGRIATGDLSADNIRVRSTDEIGALATSFNQMKSNLRDLIQQVTVSAQQVATSSEELTANAEQTSQASTLITETIQEVVMSSEKQALSVEDSVRAMNEMSSGVQQIAANAQMASSVSMQAAHKTVEGNEAIQSAQTQMSAIESSFGVVAGEVQQMGNLSGEIGQIINAITDIAYRTNLLALNAAIEAARAGEHGRGFAVVAGEIRKLAEQSSRSAEQVTELIDQIRGSIDKAVQSVATGTTDIHTGTQVVHTAGSTFEEIKAFVNQVASQVQEVSAASQQMSASAEQVVHAFDVIVEGSRTVASGSQNVSATTEEQLASMEEITSSASSLSKMSEELQALVGKFKV